MRILPSAISIIVDLDLPTQYERYASLAANHAGAPSTTTWAGALWKQQ
jgi:hypothetical protein